jgi:hypothetical protein
MRQAVVTGTHIRWHRFSNNFPNIYFIVLTIRLIYRETPVFQVSYDTIDAVAGISANLSSFTALQKPVKLRN